MRILAIETSCDETAISILEASGGFLNPQPACRQARFKILSNIVASQVKIHAKWGGVVPNLAKREHIKNLPIVLKKAMAKAKIKPASIDAIAVTVGPGLEPALWTGINFAVDLNLVWDKPIIAVNHMEGHIVAGLLITNPAAIKFPALALLVSGGHTELVLIKDWLKYKIIGQTRDDAVGEAFDKVARMLGLPYPGGPAVAKLAKMKSGKTPSVEEDFKLPRPMINSKDFDFSFSGLKTAVLYKIKELGGLKTIDYKLKTALCAEFQQAAIDVLISKTLRAAKKYKVKTVILGGGVAANEELRKQLSSQMSAISSQTNLLLPEIKLTTDNAAMIAAAAYFRACLSGRQALKKEFTKNPSRLKANGNLILK